MRREICGECDTPINDDDSCPMTTEAMVEAVARAICAACDEDPDHEGDTRGNEFRWQDFRDVALAAISALTAMQLPAEQRAEIDWFDEPAGGGGVKP